MVWVFGLWIFFSWGLTLSTDGAEVSCHFGRSCMLPCTFTAGDDTVIHWFYKTPVQIGVYSYYGNKDQLEQQDQRFKGRTSLFPDQISRGNASLQLTGVRVQDEGTYRCHTSTSTDGRDTFINMTVYAPPQKINMRQSGNQIICSSDLIFPEPHLSWSISQKFATFKYRIAVQKTEELLYNISSSLTPSDSEEDLDYICTIRTPSQQRTASWRRRPIISGEANISCSSSDSFMGFSLVWKFNQSQMIATKNKDDKPRVSEEWKQHVKDVSESGRLTLHHLSADHEGTYTCEVSNDGNTSVTEVPLRFVFEEKGNSCVISSSTITVVVINILVGLWIF